MISGSKRWAPSVLIAVWSWLAPQLTAAQPAPTDAQVQQARSHGRDAILLMQNQDYAGAERALTQALGLHAAPTLHYMRGQARERLGKLFGATSDYQAAAGFAQTADEHPRYAQARQDALARLAELPSSIPRLTLSASGSLVRVSVNGVAWPIQSLPASRSLDPGTYAIETLDESGRVRTYQVKLELGAQEALTLEGTREPEPLEVKQSVSPVRAPVAAVSDSSEPSKSARYVLGATTLTLTAAAVVTGIVALQRRSEFHEHNRPDVAMADKLSMRDSASTWGWVSTALSGAALASAATFVYFTVVPSSGPSATAELQVHATGRF